MATEIEFVGGLIAKAPNEGAPSYVKVKLSIKRAELIDWLQGKQGEWINLEVKESAGGKWYASVDNWKPNQEASPPPRQAKAPADFDDGDMPF